MMAVIQLLKVKEEALKELCDKYHVLELDLFGSALTTQFNAESDLDFVVRFGHVSVEDYADNFFDFRDSLSALFERKIDLVEVQTLKNEYFKQVVERTKQPVYARG